MSKLEKTIGLAFFSIMVGGLMAACGNKRSSPPPDDKEPATVVSNPPVIDTNTTPDDGPTQCVPGKPCPKVNLKVSLGGTAISNGFVGQPNLDVNWQIAVEANGDGSEGRELALFLDPSFGGTANPGVAQPMATNTFGPAISGNPPDLAGIVNGNMMYLQWRPQAPTRGQLRMKVRDISACKGSVDVAMQLQCYNTQTPSPQFDQPILVGFVVDNDLITGPQASAWGQMACAGKTAIESGGTEGNSTATAVGAFTTIIGGLAAGMNGEAVRCN